MYQLGLGVTKDYVNALKWYRKAAEEEYPPAYAMIGIMYESGYGVQQDYSEAAHWYRKSADLGNAPAQYSLGAMYRSGKGGPRNYVLAHKWLSLAAAYWLTSDEPGRVKAIVQRNILESSMTPEQIIEARSMARDWKPISLLQGE